MLAFSRILQDQEVVVVANTDAQAAWAGEVLVDFALNPTNTPYEVLFSNQGSAPPPARVVHKPVGEVVIQEVEGGTTPGPARALPVHLQPMEIQILGKIE